MPGPQPRPGILDIQAYVGGKADTEGRSDVAKLSANESPLGPSPAAIEAYRGLATSLHRYPDGGSIRLRAALATFAGRDPARIVCGAGSDELISLLLQAYAGPGDEVIHSAHGFLMYRLSALAVGATPVAAPETADLMMSVDAILARVTERTRLVFLANPNNPTGTYLPSAEIARLHAGLPAHVLLVIDAAYTEYVDRPDYDDGFALADAAPNVVVLRTFSKIMGLAALRLGWCYAPAAVVDVLNRVRGPFNVSAAAQAAGVAALADTAHLAAAKAHNDRWLPWLTAELTGLGFELTPSVGNFVLVRTPSADHAKTMLATLEAGGVLARAMGGYGLPDCVRISVGLEAENRRVVELLAAADLARVA
ncbi:MAG: histidinol-phosphate transaminase [Geminicoccaceae bacterium]|nr:MAG: histidinol-phosphate transaminase [Geminicoccaceae bacterium]